MIQERIIITYKGKLIEKMKKSELIDLINEFYQENETLKESRFRYHFDD